MRGRSALGSTARWLAVAVAAAVAPIHPSAAESASGLNYGPDVTAEALLDQILAEPVRPTPQPAWHANASLYGGFGYKENVLYSALHQQNSPFSSAEFDLFLFHVGGDLQELSLYAFADQRHYFDLDRGENEQSVLAEANWTRRSPAGHAVSLQGMYAYFDQFFDASLSQADIESLRLRQHEYGGRNHLEWAAGGGWFLRAGAELTDVSVVDFDDDYWAWEGLAQIEYRLAERGEAGIAYTRGEEDYDDRLQRSAAGDRVDGSPVDIATDSLCVYGRWYWDAARRWRTQLKWTAYSRDDDGGGYYDYQSWRSRLSLRGPWAGFQWEGGLYYGETDYDVRPSQFGSEDAPLLYRTRMQAWLRAERALTRHWLGFAEVSWEDNDANDPLDVYRQSWGSAGIGRRL